jgi:hypothetical protein
MVRYQKMTPVNRQLAYQFGFLKRKLEYMEYKMRTEKLAKKDKLATKKPRLLTRD